MTIDNQPATRRGGVHTGLGSAASSDSPGSTSSACSMPTASVTRTTASTPGSPTSEPTSCSRSTRTWSSSAASTPRRPPCSARASSACGRRCSARRPRRSAPARALRRDDFVFSSYREHGVAYCRGAGLVDLLRVWRGTAQTGWNPYDINMATPQVIIGAQTLHATGYALGIQADGTDAVAVAYFGDGATSEGDVSEALVFAATYAAPVIFFCQNNQCAISEPVVAAGAASHRRPRAGLRGAERPRRRQRRPRRDGRDPRGPRPRALRRRTDLHRGRHLPDGAAHHRGRPDPLPRRRPSSRSGAPRTRSRRVEAYLAAAGRADGRSGGRDRREGRRRRRRDALRASPRSPTRTRCPSSTTSTPSRTRASPASGDHYSRYLRTFVGSDGPMTALTMAKAINAGLRRALADDDRVVLMGEDIGTLGGVFRVTDGLQTEFGPRRVMDTPLAESGILGTAVGLAYRGLPSGRRDPVRRLHLPGLRPDREPGGADALPHARRGADADHHPRAVRRRHRRGRAPLRLARGVLRPHRGPARGEPVRPRRTPTR